MKLTSENIEREILRREKSKGRDLNVTDVRTCLRHLWQILEEQGEEIESMGMKFCSNKRALDFVSGRIAYYRKKFHTRSQASPSATPRQGGK